MALTLLEIAYIMIPASLVIVLGLTWHFSDRILSVIVSRILGWLVGRYVLNPDGYGRYVEILREAATPHLGSLLPHLGRLRPVLSSMMGGENTCVAKRVGDYIAVEYRYRDTTYVALHQYTNGSEIRHAMALNGSGGWDDVTAKVRKYAGPCGDFHGQRVKPVDLVRDCKELHIRYSDEVVLTVAEEDTIDIVGLHARSRCSRCK